uniref:Uncharacterized protein n=1 Tax=Anolis carolinensis TaxID=28377 RepID=H9GSU3_ANOCA
MISTPTRLTPLKYVYYSLPDSLFVIISFLCSEMRQVPDNQEVFVHPSTDQSLIIELLEYQAGVPDENATRYFSGLYGHVPGAFSPDVSPTSLAGILRGCEAKNEVTLHLALLRLPQYGTDLLLTFNDPTRIQLDYSQIWLKGTFQRYINLTCLVSNIPHNL